MIIDTESKEGRALVALAKLGEWALIEGHGEFIADLDGGALEEMAISLGLLTGVQCDGSCNSNYCDNDPDNVCYRWTDLAKLPKGL